MITNDPAIGHWKAILTACRIDPDALTGKQAPCPMCGGKDRFRFDDKQQRGTWFCNQCGAGDGYKLLMFKTSEDFKTAKARIQAEYGGTAAKPAAAKKDWRPILNNLWRTADHDNPALQDYLRSRGLKGQQHAVLRFHPRCPYTDGTRHGKAPAMLARVFQEGKPVTIHRTFLTDDVPSRRMMMPHNGTLHGAYIPLGDNPTGKALGVAEGIETALAVLQTLCPNYPVWSCINAGQMEQFEPPKGIDILSIFGDNDKTYTGQAASYSLARRLSNRIDALRCEVLIPKVAGWDWNDALIDQQGKA